ncbi:hypothetical protein [Niabella ginsenosidivorans]|uniref:hypothetical protein n=1 Tax=Niabella ginsenosidivorans TaxID=1176587 RepID=UPI0012ED11AF|nr:hypothetical protein [Niabella ginsenosidivorans]
MHIVLLNGCKITADGAIAVYDIRKIIVGIGKKGIPSGKEELLLIKEEGVSKVVISGKT